MENEDQSNNLFDKLMAEQDITIEKLKAIDKLIADAEDIKGTIKEINDFVIADKTEVKNVYKRISKKYNKTLKELSE